MKRRWFAVLGAFLLVSQGAALVVFDFPRSDAEAALSLVAWMFVGALFILGGLSVQIGTIVWYQFIGGSFVVMGITFGLDFPLTTLNDASLGDAGVIFAIAGIVGGLSMIFIGVDWIRGGHYLEISQYEAGPILSSTNRNRT